MSETETNTSGACELVLDYVYGELDEARKRTFEEHLPTCARCQQEVASFGRVRTAVKRVMPAVEPSASLGGGALHAQLMHAAAQRKPRRGVLLAFPRKIVEHPALSAAAMFVLVGGAIAINWSRGKMEMPIAEHTSAPTPTSVDAPKPTEAAPQGNVELAKTANAPAAEPMVAAKDKEAEQAADDGTLSLATGKGSYTVQRPTAHRAVATASPKKEAPPRMKSISSDGKMGKYDSAFADQLSGKDEAGNANGLEGATTRSGGVAGGAIGGGGRGAAATGAKSSAPGDLSRKEVVAEKAPAREEKQQQAQHGYAAGEPATMPQAQAPPPPAPAAATSTPPSTANERDYYRSQSQAVAKPAANARSYDVLRKQADEFAQSGRCDEAIKLYRELEKSSQYLSPNERVYFVRCLTESGRQEEAQQRLDDLKQDKRVTNALIQDVEKKLNDSRSRRVDNKKAKKAPAADRAPAQTQSESVQQKRAAEPAPQSPPDSTNTKIQNQNQKSTTSY